MHIGGWRATLAKTLYVMHLQRTLRIGPLTLAGKPQIIAKCRGQAFRNMM